MVATEAPFSSRQCLSLCPLDTPARQGLSYLLVRSRGSEGQVVTDSFGFNPRATSPEPRAQSSAGRSALALLSLLCSAPLLWPYSFPLVPGPFRGVSRPSRVWPGQLRPRRGGPSPRQDWGKGSLQSGSRQPSPRGCRPGGYHRSQGCLAWAWRAWRAHGVQETQGA